MHACPHLFVSVFNPSRHGLPIAAAIHRSACLQVHDTLRLLRLLPFRDSLIGVPGLGGIPPEARKLVTIGVELVCEPVVLFMDEPTTGK